MDHVFSGKPTCRGRHRLARRNRAPLRTNPTALVRDHPAACAVNGTTYSATGQQVRVGRIDYGVGRVLSEVTAQESNLIGLPHLQHHDVITILRQLCSNLGQEMIPQTVTKVLDR